MKTADSYLNALCFFCAALLLSCHSQNETPIVGQTSSNIVEGYSCPSTCVAPDCICPVPQPPGGLARSSTPQIVLLTVDDAVTPPAFDAFESIQRPVSPNGCPLRATFFVNTDFTDYWLAQRLHASGHEIAIHTMTHNTNLHTDFATWKAEIKGARDALSQLGGIPMQELVGFRAPYLIYEDESFRALAELGMEYDSSISEPLGGLSLADGEQIWPYTLDFGAGQNCWTGQCPTTPRPGMFEIPMWALLNPDGTPHAIMDPPGDRAETFDLLQRGLTARRAGSRAPFGIFLHAGWFTPEHKAGLEDFFAWAEGLGDVWFVTNHQLIEFMRQPMDINGAPSLEAFACTSTTTGVEICDGIDNDADGQIDENLTSACQYAEGSFQTCAACPSSYPQPDFPSPNETLIPLSGGSLTLTVSSEWASGYCADVTITNGSSASAIQWEAVIDTDTSSLTSSWSARFTPQGQQLIINELEPLPAGSSLTVGFCASRSDLSTATAESIALWGASTPTDAGIPDTSVIDGGPPPDAGVEVDAGFIADAGVVDTGFIPDAGIVDAGSTDADTPDTGNSSGGGSGLSVTWRETSTWSGGHCGAIVVTAGPEPVSTWTVDFDHAGVLSTSWNGVFTPTASGHQVMPTAWGGALAAGVSTEVGYCASPPAIPSSLVVY